MQLASEFQLPKRDKLRSEMIDLSNQITNQLKSDVKYKKVSILFDSCSRWGKKYQGIIWFTVQRLFLWSIVSTNDAKAKTLRDIILDVINTLESNQKDVICVCTDNSKANIAAFDEKYPHHEYQYFIRVPCSAHTADLTIKDMLERDQTYVLLLMILNF